MWSSVRSSPVLQWRQVRSRSNTWRRKLSWAGAEGSGAGLLRVWCVTPGCVLVLNALTCRETLTKRGKARKGHDCPRSRPGAPLNKT